MKLKNKLNLFDVIRMELLETALMNGVTSWTFCGNQLTIMCSNINDEGKMIQSYYWMEWDNEQGCWWVYVQDVTEDGINTGPTRLFQSKFVA